MRLQSALAFPAAGIDSRFALKLPELVSTAETRRMRGGNQGLAGALAAELHEEVRLGCTVREVRREGEGIRVVADGGEFTAAACVVAMPVALLGDLRFDPPLDPAIENGIAAIRTGTAAKLAVPLHEPAAPRAVMSAADRFWIWTTPSDEVGARSVGAWAGAAPVLERLGVGAGPERWLDRVGELCPDLELDRANARLTVWEQDPWARGAYSVLPPQRTPAAESAATAAAPNLVFAGEHTAEPGWTGTMEGALRSGRRAAAELLGARHLSIGLAATRLGPRRSPLRRPERRRSEMSFDRVRGPLAVTVTLVVAGLALVAIQGSAAAGVERAGSKPKLVQLSYEESKDGSSRHYGLSAFAHKADSVVFAVRRHHKRITAPGRYNDHITDTDLHPEDASHPWEVNRKEGGRKVVKAIRASLSHDGVATVRVTARSAAGKDRAKVKVIVADCAQDPPFYPLSCEIAL